MPSAPIARPPIPSVVSQHLQEAAFCWLRRQDGLWSPSHQPDHVRRFDALLDAHLEGLRVAGFSAASMALDALEQWKTEDEAFVSAYVLTHAPEEAGLARLEAVLLEEPAAARGAAAALLWAEPETALGLAERWIQRAASPLRRAAFPAVLKLAGAGQEYLLRKGTQDEDPSMRARAYRGLGERGCSNESALLHQGLNEEDPRARFEAIYGLALLGDTSFVEHLPSLLEELSPTAQRRALVLWGTYAEPRTFAPWIQQSGLSPEQDRQRLWALAFRGDLAWQELLVERLEDPKQAKLAAYALGHITGLDVDLDGLDKPAEEGADGGEELEEEPTEDVGLLEPDPDAVKTWLVRNAGSWTVGGCYLAGAPLDGAQAQQVLQTGWQPQRWQAALLLAIQGHRGALQTLRDPLLNTHGTRRLRQGSQEEDWKAQMLVQAKRSQR